MKDMILFPEDIDRLNTILEQLAVKANLLLSVLINKDGRLLTYQGTLEKIDTVSMAALVAGNSASTLAIANLMGETEFSEMYNHGKDRHIYISVVDDNTFLCLVFDQRTNIDRVKVFARQFDRQIKKALVLVYDKTEDQVDLDLGFGMAESTATPSAISGKHTYHPEPTQPFHSDHQQDAGTIKQDLHHEPYPQPSTIKSKSEPPKPPGDNEEVAFFPEVRTQGDKPIGEVNDTNYLYLKKKIRETVKRKKEP